MKIVYASLSYLPTVAGGVQVLTHSIAKEMQSRGHEVEVICAESIEDGEDDRVRGDRTEYDGLMVDRIRFNRHRMPEYFQTFYDVPPVGEYVAKIFAQRKPDLFHVMHFSRLSASIFDGMHQLGAPILLTLADYAFLCPLGTLLRYNGEICAGADRVGGLKCFGCFVDDTRTYKNSPARHMLNADQVAAALDAVDHVPGIRNALSPLYRGAGRIFRERVKYFEAKRQRIGLFTTNNHWSRQFYIDHGFPEGRIRCVVQTVDLSWAQRFVRTPYDGPLRIGFTGAVVNHKGVEVLLRAYLRMKFKDRARLVIFGENESHPMYISELERLRNGDERIEFKGRYSPADLCRIYDQMDVMVAPSMFYETGPLVILEAHATKTPAIASDLGPIRELVRDGIDGYLFERGNDEKLAAILDHLCEHREELNRLRANIRPVKTIAAMADELETLYRELTERRAT